MSSKWDKFHPTNRSNVYYSQARRQEFAAGGQKSQGGAHLKNTILNVCSIRHEKSRSRHVNFIHIYLDPESYADINAQARNQLGTPRGEKSFLRGAQTFYTMSKRFELCPEHFSRGSKFFRSLPWLRACERRNSRAPSFALLQFGQGKRQEIAYFANR